MYSVSDETRKPIFEGVQGENESREIQFDISSWIEELGEGVCTATAKRPTDTTPYPVTVTRSGNVVTWKPNSTDTSIEGIGAFQLAFSINDVVAKTRIWNTKIAPSLVGAGDPPDPYDDWIQDLRDIAAETLTYSQNAENSADDAKAEKLESEAWAKGTKNGTPVPSTADQYENNAKYWAEQSLANQYAAFIVKSASGQIASFNDGADNVPMKSVNVTITPKQSGSGDPSPSNVRPITGWTDADVHVTGANVWDEEWLNGYYSTSGTFVSNSGFLCNKNPIPVLPSTTYYLKCPDVRFEVLGYDINGGYVGRINANIKNATFTTPANVYYIGFSSYSTGTVTTYNHDISINYPASDTAYHPYDTDSHTTPVPLGQTVYGGEVNPSTGELKITHAYKTFGQLSWYLQSGDNTGNLFYAPILDAVDVNSIGHTGWCDKYACYVKGEEAGWWYRNMGDLKFIYSVSGISNQKRIYVRDNSYTDASSFASANANTQLVYELATPTTVQLTPTQVASLLGQNNVWADCGAVEVEYRADPTLAYAELQALILENI